MPQNTFFPRNCNLLFSQKITQRHFFPTLHPLSPVIFATATVVAFVLLRNFRFNFHCYTQHEATPTQKSALKSCCDLSRLLAQKITKGIHWCKPASLKRPIADSFAGLFQENFDRHLAEDRRRQEEAMKQAIEVRCRFKQHFIHSSLS